MSALKSNINLTFETWQKFDLESVKKELDDKVIEIAQQLDEGDQSKKRLIEQTKDFRKNLNEEQRKLVGPILKSFQIEVDSSNKRCKLMEQVLLKLYKQLIDLPDPVASLENTSRLQKRAERVQDLEIENKQLRETLEEYNVEFAQVKNQEVTIKNLNNKIKELEEKIEQTVQQRLKEKEKELQKLFSDKEDQMQQTQFDLVKKLGETEARNLSLQSQLTKLSTEMYDFKSKQDEQLNAKSCEVDLLLSDLDKMTERAVNAERLNEQYAKQIASNKETLSEIQSTTFSSEPQIESSASNFSAKAIELELLQKEKEISQLVEDIKKLQVKSNKSREFYESQRQQLEEKLVSRERTLEQLEYELRKKHDYEEIKKELNILKAIEFNIPTDNNLGFMVTNEVGAPGNNEPLQNIQQKSLEVLFLEKNRYLQNENTQIKSKLNDLQIKYDETFKQKSALLVTNLEQKNLILLLEKDLLNLANNKALGSSNPSLIDNNNSAAEILVDDETPSDINTSSSLFNIVSNQRERFRQRIQELESENVGNKQQIMFLTNEIDRLRSDNVKLYEKIKFLQSAGTGKSTKNKLSNNSEDAFLNEDSNIVLNKYTTEYEKRLDPFAKFNFNEKQKRYANLKFHDKFTLNFGRFILSTKMTRLIFFAYFLIIHFLIFLSSYHMAHHDKDVRAYSAQCAEAYKDHMDKAHGMHDFTVPI